jgi:hypothetical protein
MPTRGKNAKNSAPIKSTELSPFPCPPIPSPHHSLAHPFLGLPRGTATGTLQDIAGDARASAKSDQHDLTAPGTVFGVCLIGSTIAQLLAGGTESCFGKELQPFERNQGSAALARPPVAPIHIFLRFSRPHARGGPFERVRNSSRTSSQSGSFVRFSIPAERNRSSICRGPATSRWPQAVQVSSQ